MDKLFKSSVSFLLAACIITGVANAQPDTKDKKIKKEETKTIIVTDNSGKDEKMTIVVDGDKVTVNGKPVDEKDENVNVKVIKIKDRSDMVMRDGQFDPFADAWSADGQDLQDRIKKEVRVRLEQANENTAMLGVVTNKTDDGLQITNVSKESAAEKAGLKENDIILSIDDKKVEDADDLTKIIRAHKPGDKVNITYKRDKKEQKVTAELGKWKGEDIQIKNFNWNSDENRDWEALMPRSFNRMQGFKVMPDQNLTSAMGDRPRLGMSVQDTDDGKGVKVIDVDEEENAGKAGIKEDDIITAINGTEVNSADQVAKIVRENKDKPSISVKLNRDGKTQTVEVRMPRKLKTANL